MAEGLLRQDFDYVITVCDRENETCPIFPSDPERIHWNFEDPSQAKGTDEERLKVFRTVRDAILGRLGLFQTVAARL